MTDLEALAARVEGAKDVAAIAAGLTKAQRQVLDAASLRGGDWCVYYIGARSTMHALVRKGIVQERVGIANCLTPLGTAVRTHLTAGATHDR